MGAGKVTFVSAAADATTGRRRAREIAWVAGTTALSMAVVAVVMRLWDASITVPFHLGGDNTPLLAAVKGLIDHGWYATNPDLGAPAGQELIYFAGGTAETLQWLGLKLLALVFSSAPVVVNLYLLLSFPLLAAITFLVLRDLGMGRPSSAVMALAYSLLPYHFWQAQAGHVQLANYVAVPLAGWLVVRVLRGSSIVRRRDNRAGWTAWASGRTLATAGAVIIIGGTNLYYAIFAIILVALAAVVRLVATRSWRAVVPAAGVVAGVVVVLFANVLPLIAYRAANGDATGLAQRAAHESEAFSFSLINLVLPVEGHRIGAFADQRAAWLAGTTVRGEGGVALGAIFSAGFVAAIILVLAWVLRPSAATTPGPARAASVGAILAFVVGTFGGVSSLVAFLVTPQLRVWSRLTPFVAFFCAVIVAIALDALVRWLRRRTGGDLAGGVALALVALLAVADQTTSSNVPPYAANAQQWNAMQGYIGRVEQSVPEGSSVLQLPVQSFPEPAWNGRTDFYDALLPYLHSSGLRWSYGAMRGRPADWGAYAAALTPSEIVPAAAAAGFSGVYLDRAATADGGAQVDSALRALPGLSGSAITSDDGRMTFVPLQGVRAALVKSQGEAAVAELGQALINPVSLVYGPAFFGAESDAAGSTWRWASSPATIELTNPLPRAQGVRMRFVLQASAPVRWSYRGEPRGILRVPGGTAPVSLALEVPPGRTTLVFNTRGGDLSGPDDPRDLRMRFVDVSLVSEVIQPVEASTGG